MSKNHISLKGLGFLIVFVMCCTLMLFSIDVCAEVKEKNVYYMDKEGGTFYISMMYEKSDIKLALKDPDDNEVQLNSANVEYVQSESTVFIIVKNAKRGQWKLIYDKGSNDELLVQAYAEEEPMVIDSLKFGSMDADNNLPVSFRVTQPDGRNFNYEIRIGTYENMDDYRVLKKGYGYEGEITETEVPLKDVNTYDKYYFQIIAYYDRDNMRYMETLVSDPFSYTNPDGAPDAIEDFKVTVDMITNSIDVDISEYVPWEAKSYCINIKEDGAEQDPVIVIRSDGGDVTNIQLKDGTKIVECSVTLQNDAGRISAPLTKTVYLTGRQGQFWMNLPESDTINSTNYTISYENALDQAVYTKIDDKREEEIVLNGGGKHLIPVGDTSAQLRISYQADDNIWYVYDTIVTVDVIPPELKIYEALNGIVTDDKNIVLTGKTDADAVLTVNGNETEKNEDGSFSLELDLADGLNNFDIKSTDGAGNISTYAFAITYSKDGQAPTDVDADLDDLGDGSSKGKAGGFGKWLWLVALIFIVAMVITTFLVIFIGIKKRTLNQNMFRGGVVTCSFAIVGFIADLIYYITRRSFQNSEKYIDLSATNIHEAYSYLSITRLSGWLLVLLILFILASAGVILFAKLSGRKLGMPGFIKNATDKATQKAAEWKKQREEPWNMQTPEAWSEQNHNDSTEGDWKICKHCGAKNRKAAKFCIKCGKPSD
ncbi:zinc-ribbon domain-containing protein [Butyrivibrio sp. AC2005]|uniref:zinc-ribbon domain-containing protein n=1 Tax=Butyrivibrio sp. AC2005 TaxID=1280672 RepID=UPI0003FE4734|nr:zinc-ribbon domain-containing protein [Butyrivibrio sp. AC2005]